VIQVAWSTISTGANQGYNVLKLFNIDYKEQTSTTWITTETLVYDSSSTFTYDVTGLSSNTTYDFRVSADNGYGRGPDQTVFASDETHE